MKNNLVKSLALAAAVSAAGATAVLASGGIKSAVFVDYKMYLNNREVQLSNPLAAIVRDGASDAATYIPAREFFEKTGYNVNWNGADHSIRLTPKVMSSPDDFENQMFPLVAADYGEGAYLYAIGYDSAALKYRGVSRAFDWPAISPEFILPVMRIFDYDGDGEKEVAISSHSGTGTGLSVDELHIIEMETDAGGDYNGMTDHKFAPEAYNKQISDGVAYKVSDDGGRMFIDISSGTSSARIDITDYAREVSAAASDIRFSCGYFIGFTPDEDGAIKMRAGLGVYTEKRPGYINYIAGLTADVAYKDGALTLSGMSVSAGYF